MDQIEGEELEDIIKGTKRNIYGMATVGTSIHLLEGEHVGDVFPHLYAGRTYASLTFGESLIHYGLYAPVGTGLLHTMFPQLKNSVIPESTFGATSIMGVINVLDRPAHFYAELTGIPEWARSLRANHQKAEENQQNNSSGNSTNSNEIDTIVVTAKRPSSRASSRPQFYTSPSVNRILGGHQGGGNSLGEMEQQLDEMMGVNRPKMR